MSQHYLPLQLSSVVWDTFQHRWKSIEGRWHGIQSKRGAAQESVREWREIFTGGWNYLPSGWRSPDRNPTWVPVQRVKTVTRVSLGSHTHHLNCNSTMIHMEQNNRVRRGNMGRKNQSMKKLLLGLPVIWTRICSTSGASGSSVDNSEHVGAWRFIGRVIPPPPRISDGNRGGRVMYWEIQFVLPTFI